MTTPGGCCSQREAQRRTGERIREELRGYEAIKKHIAREGRRKRAKRKYMDSLAQRVRYGHLR